MRRILAAALLTSLALPAAAHDPGYRFANVSLVSVYDGDTLRVYLPGVHPLWGDSAGVRIDGIDTPEIRGKCAREIQQAIAARDRLRVMLESARIDLVDCGREKYGRLLCRVLADGEDVGEQLVSEELARRYDGGEREGWCGP